ncbi:MAG: hypothetical protein COV57_01685 [Candidatus Liptonbacteria bacterium CG11_big_fil_rev_8_21_14_0_20_35_14]|uniref:Pilus assembly protein PilO n=1 Tax=Candidatus Liptonbacteria bacterium CG11_big_fil_rev_8_21_14_0_20_35_14 TaxID=1974634 RepID=A0A2H0N7S9_9BACT|nr:MAG: hypothetical protein COV57_01685 [Candidatus Liptonbacteria bacterium CG11_big_fil_rev_8_21_14_0_20_35_14]
MQTNTSNKRMLSLLLAVILLLLSLYLFGAYVRPAFLSVRVLREEVAQARDFLEAQQNAKAAFESLALDVDESLNAQNLLASALPKGADLPQSVHQIQFLAKVHNMSLQAVTVEEVANAVSSNSNSLIKDVKKMRITFSAFSDYNSMKRFLEALENNIKLIDVVEMTAQAQGDSGLSFTFVVDTYYQE